MSNLYGVQIGNLPTISGDRKIMRLLVLGQTRRLSDKRHAFSFQCNHRDFCVYFRPITYNVPTASQIVLHTGSGNYEAYFVGSPCDVYVYERKQSAANGRYGLFLYNDSQEVAFDHTDEPMRPLPDLFIPPLGVGGRVHLFDTKVAGARAINLHCVRGALVIDFRNRQYRIYRDAVILDDSGLHYVYGFGSVSRGFSGSGGNIPIDTSGSRWSTLNPQKPTSVGVVDTSIHH